MQSEPSSELKLSMSRDSKVRVAKDHSKKFRIKLVIFFRKPSTVDCFWDAQYNS